MMLHGGASLKLDDAPLPLFGGKIDVEIVKRQIPLLPNRLLFKRKVQGDGRFVSFIFDMEGCEEQLRSHLEYEDYTHVQTMVLCLDSGTYNSIEGILHCFDEIPLYELKQVCILCTDDSCSSHVVPVRLSTSFVRERTRAWMSPALDRIGVYSPSSFLL